jgi:hypothetical protein
VVLRGRCRHRRVGGLLGLGAVVRGMSWESVIVPALGVKVRVRVRELWEVAGEVYGLLGNHRVVGAVLGFAAVVSGLEFPVV